MNDSRRYIAISLPSTSTRRERQAFTRLCAALASRGNATSTEPVDRRELAEATQLGDFYEQPTLAAAALTLMDLVGQGWSIVIDKSGAMLRPPSPAASRDEEKLRVQRQEHLRRDEQLRKPSVRRFIEAMERVHEHQGELVSVFDLMRDGQELAEALASSAAHGDAIKPYIQFVDDSTCALTGFRLHDIWRYFRHTWSNAYATVPGRSMPLLVRDAATPRHAVIGLAAISSPVVQIAERDSWMGWDVDQVLKAIAAQPTEQVAQWLESRVRTQIEEIYVADLLRDGILEPSASAVQRADVVGRLRADAERYRMKHHRASNLRVVRSVGTDAWVERAESYLFRSKRSAALAEALEIAGCLGRHLEASTTAVQGLESALADPKARAQIRRVIRHARGERVGTVVADLTVCGAVAPYNALAAGKLVGALAVSPRVLAAYRTRYSRPSEIASAMAGRAVEREARLSFIGTTSLYGSGSSQYNRLYWPASVMGGDVESRIGFIKVGRSRSFGTSHFSDETVAALARLSQLQGSLVRVNSIFGEGVSPRLRKVRLGLAALGWPANELLKHGRERILYGVPLVRNLRDFSLGIDPEPDYLLNPDLVGADEEVSAWWLERWALRRAAQPRVQEQMRRQRLLLPIQHGARVRLPDDDLEELGSDAGRVAGGAD